MYCSVWEVVVVVVVAMVVVVVLPSGTVCDNWIAV